MTRQPCSSRASSLKRITSGSSTFDRRLNDHARDEGADRMAAYGPRPIEAGPAGFRIGSLPADYDAAVVARLLRLHQQKRRLHLRKFRASGVGRGLSRTVTHHHVAGDAVGSDLLRRGGTDGLASVAHRHAAAPPVRLLVTASFVTPPFL